MCVQNINVNISEKRDPVLPKKLDADGEPSMPLEHRVTSKLFWMDEDVETLPREKLLEIIHSLTRDLESTRAMMKSILEINEMARKLRNNKN